MMQGSHHQTWPDASVPSDECLSIQQRLGPEAPEWFAVSESFGKMQLLEAFGRFW